MGVKPRRLELFCTRKSLAMVDMLIIQHWTFFPLSGAKCFHNFFFLLPSHSLAKEQKSCVDNGKCSTQLNLRIREYSSHPGNEALFRRLRGFSSTPTAPPPTPLTERRGEWFNLTTQSTNNTIDNISTYNVQSLV